MTDEMHQLPDNLLTLSLIEIMDNWPATIQVFLGHHTLCVGCTIAPFHTVKNTCREYGLDEATLLKELEDAILKDQ